MIKIYVSNYHDIYKNIAIERYLFKNSKDDLILFLWSNHPCVVFGRNQNVFNEVNISYAKDKKISLARRFSGGGAVYQDEGNLNYTFISKNERDIEFLNKILIEVFNNLHIDAYFSGRNDLLIQGKKFSGIAYCNDFHHLMYHGTCLIDANIETLEDVLKPHQYKLRTHSISSYKSRVINLKDAANISKQDVIDSFIAVLKKYSDIELTDSIDLNSEMLKLTNFLKNDDFIFNDCPSYTYKMDIRLNNANYTFELEYKDGIIFDVSCFTDDLNVANKEKYKKNLLGQKIPIESIETYLLKIN